VPARLPGAALGWPLLFHLERASVLLATGGMVLLVGWRALHGEFPIKVGNMEYAVREAASRADEVSVSHARRLELLETAVHLAPIPPPRRSSLPMAMDDDEKPTDRQAEADEDREAERERFLEQARREIPALREQSKRGIEGLRRIANGEFGR
jgi:hypothetical protein